MNILLVCSALETHISIKIVRFIRFHFWISLTFPILIISFCIIIFHTKIFEIGLCTDHGQINSVIVLAGDPKQLDAVTMSRNAKNFGYKTSFMAYLQNNKKCYDESSPTSDMIQLTKNYRSHPSILKLPNELFYNNRLEPQSDTG